MYNCIKIIIFSTVWDNSVLYIEKIICRAFSFNSFLMQPFRHFHSTSILSQQSQFCFKNSSYIYFSFTIYFLFCGAHAQKYKVNLVGHIIMLMDILNSNLSYLSYVSGKVLGGNSQNFLQKFVKFFLTLRWFYKVIIHRK